MQRPAIEALLRAVQAGSRSVEDAAELLVGELRLPELTLDLGRDLRLGAGEVVYGEGKTAAQIAEALAALHARSGLAFATRVDAGKADEVLERLPAARWAPAARVVSVGEPAERGGTVAVLGAGTSDGPVVAEVVEVLRLLGHAVRRVDDVGVAGLHRLLARAEELRGADVLVVVAGMDGALPSVVAGLWPQPVIAVPTSVGYGAAFAGLAPLLGMLNSCAPGVLVVNIDNGFGAAFAASRICRGRG